MPRACAIRPFALKGCMSVVASPKRLVNRWSVRGPNGQACAGHRRGSMLFWPYAPMYLMTPTMRSVRSTVFLWLDYLQLFHTPHIRDLKGTLQRENAAMGIF